MNNQAENTGPWYRHRWPWVLVAIPAITVIACMYTLYLAITHPDHLVVDENQYNDIRSELRAQTGKGEPQSGEDDGQR